jgi:hypothetical protein
MTLKSLDVVDLVVQSLSANGLDGLYSPEGCACSMDDLAPCGEIQGDCEGGVVKRFPSGKCDGNYECDGDCGFHVMPKLIEVEGR